MNHQQQEQFDVSRGSRHCSFVLFYRLHADSSSTSTDKPRKRSKVTVCVKGRVKTIMSIFFRTRISKMTIRSQVKHDTFVFIPLTQLSLYLRRSVVVNNVTRLSLCCVNIETNSMSNRSKSTMLSTPPPKHAAPGFLFSSL